MGMALHSRIAAVRGMTHMIHAELRGRPWRLDKRADAGHEAANCSHM